MLNSVDKSPWPLHCANFYFHHLNKSYSQTEKFLKRRKVRGKRKPDLSISYCSYNEFGQKGWVKRKPDQNTTICNFKVKTIFKNIRCFKSPGWDKKRVIADTLTATHTQRGLCWKNHCPYHHQQSYYNPIYEMQNFISQYR